MRGFIPSLRLILGGVYLIKPIYRKCFACKESINILDETLDLESLVFVDGHFYHKECYRKMNEVKKKCHYCKKDIVYNGKQNKRNVLYDNHYYHEECFDEWCSVTKTKSKKREFAKANKEEYVLNANNSLNELYLKKCKMKDISTLVVDAQKEIDSIKEQSKVNSFIKDTYNLNQISPNLWRRLSSVYKGTYKNTDTPIPPNHLLDMWERKINFLNKTYEKNIVRGKELHGDQRVVYDLAILVNKYESYLYWLEKRHLKVEKNTVLKIPAQLNKLSNQAVANKKSQSQSIDVDDIFG